MLGMSQPQNLYNYIIFCHKILGGQKILFPHFSKIERGHVFPAPPLKLGLCLCHNSKINVTLNRKKLSSEAKRYLVRIAAFFSVLCPGP